MNKNAKTTHVIFYILSLIFMSDNFFDIIESLDRSYFTDSHIDPGISRDSLLGCYDSVLCSFERDYALVTDSLDDVLIVPDSSVSQVITFINDHIEGRQPVSMCALLFGLASRLGVCDTSLYRYLAVAGVYADIPHDLPYHNNAHFKKVVLHVARLICAHNHVFENTSKTLDERRIVLLLLGATIHDLGHEGTGNIIDKQYVFAKTEKRSYNIMHDVFRACGLEDDLLQDLLIFLITTDVSPFGDPMSPSNQLRRAYYFHFGDDEEEESLDLSQELSALEARPDLCVQALMLHEADIMNSAGVSYETTIKESRAVSVEIGRQNALPEDTLLFLDKICNGQMVSPAAQFLASDIMSQIKERILEDYQNGNASYL